MIIDAHAHLWNRQQGIVNGKPVYDIGGGRSYFGGEIRQMMPAYMTDGENSVERFIANMDYACVSGAVITQEYIDGNQDDYLLSCKSDRIKICALYEEKPLGDIGAFDGIKICAGRLADKNLLNHLEPFKIANDNGKFISIDLADGDEQTEMMQEIKAFDDYIRTNFGYSSPYFRFPKGEYSDSALDLVGSLGYTSVFWSLAYADWDVNDQKGAAYAHDTVTARIHPGAVILLHAVSSDNAYALGDIIDTVRNMGYEFRSLEEM